MSSGVGEAATFRSAAQAPAFLYVDGTMNNNDIMSVCAVKLEIFTGGLSVAFVEGNVSAFGCRVRR